MMGETMEDDTVGITHPLRLTIATAVSWLVILAMVMTGCQLDDPAAPPLDTTTTTTTPPTTSTLPATTTTHDTSPQWAFDAAFVSQMRAESLEYADVTWVDIASDDLLLEWGYAMCSVLDVTPTFEAALATAFQAGEDTWGDEWGLADQMLVASGIGGAIAAFCPHHWSVLE